MTRGSFQVGDEVARKVSYFNDNEYYLGTVLKVTPSGRTIVKFDWGQETYNPDGYVRGSKRGYSYNHYQIKLVTPKLKEKILKKKTFDTAKLFFNDIRNLDKLSLGELELIQNVTNGTWLGEKKAIAKEGQET